MDKKIETPEEFLDRLVKEIDSDQDFYPAWIQPTKSIIARDALLRADERQKAAISEEVINSAINELSRLTGEDFHGYRSEIWRVLIRVSRNELSGIGEKPPALLSEPEEAQG